MNKFLLTIIFCLISYLSFSQSQKEMNEDAAKSFKAADKELNSVYQKVLTEYKADTAFTKNLRIAQKLWIQFRDAEMLVKFPKREYGYYGSVQPMCWSEYLTQLTKERISTLKIWLNGTQEGDSCSGSVKTN